MKTVLNSKPVSFFIGISLCGVAGYIIYRQLRKDDEEEDDYDSTISRTSNNRTVEFEVPKEVLRILIGRNGTNIKSIQQESNTRISFKDDDSSKKTRTCVIRGAMRSCTVAKNLVDDFINSQPNFECCDIWVPQAAVGKIIGRCGENILDLQVQSGAKINVVGDGRNDPSRRITLKGTIDQINLAKSLIEEVVEKVRASKSQMDSTLAKREPRLPPKPPSPKPPVESPKVERISPIPGQTDSQFEVYVSAMIDPSHFWLQIVGPKATELDQLVEEMTEYYNRETNRESHVLNSLDPGDLVAAVFQYDKKWYRAEVLNILSNNEKEPHAELYYVDYGDTDVLPCREVYELRTDFLRLNFQAIECYLARIDPKADAWTEDAIDRFEELTHVAQWKKLSAKMNGYCVREKTRAKREGSPVPGVDLYDVGNDQDIDIAQELVNEGYAVFKKDADVKSVSSRATSVSNISVDSN